MSDLQVGMVLSGLVLILGLLLFNRFQERRHARIAPASGRTPGEARGEEDLGERAGGRTEPGCDSVRPLPSRSGNVGPPYDPRLEFAVTLTPRQPISGTWFWQSLVKSGVMLRHVRWLGYLDPDPAAPGWALSGPDEANWVRVQGLLQLVSRSGPVNESHLNLFCDEMRTLARQLNLQFEVAALDAALSAASELERFYAEADILIGINLVANAGRGFSADLVQREAGELGMRLEQDGVIYQRDLECQERWTLKQRSGQPVPIAKPEADLLTGLTLLLDVPRVGDPVNTLREMFTCAERLAGALSARVVDDNDQPLGLRHLAAIERQLTELVGMMETYGIPPGSEPAQRLFSH